MSGAGIVANGDGKARLIAIIVLSWLLALALAPAYAAAECTVHGNVYDWSTFSTVNNAVVDVYSTPYEPGDSPVNQYVARTGSYSFSMPKGDYMLVATAGAPGSPDEITATENLTVPDSGERVIDLIMFPAGSLDDLGGFTENNTTPTPPPAGNPTQAPNPTAQPSTQPPESNWASWLGGAAIVLAIVAIAAGLLFLRALRPKKTEEPQPAEETPVVTEPRPLLTEPQEPAEERKLAAETPEPAPPSPSQSPPQQTVRDLLLPEDCRQVLAIIEKNDGRITQLDLRKALPYSEAKVSLIVSDLESRGLVKKIKKGRGNVLILNRPDERAPEK